MSGTPHAASETIAPLDDPAGTLLALDFDGTLAHIVDDPARAYVHPESIAALGRLGTILGGITIITGRPVAQALELGGFEGLRGLERLTIHGQYGAEHWDAASTQALSAQRPTEISTLAERLPGILQQLGAGAARIEDKGLALAVHTRGLDAELIGHLERPLRQVADDFGLRLEPGRQVIELRSGTVDKGTALRQVVADLQARTVVFAGDDLGDLPAFDAVDALRADGVRGVLVCSASAEQDALVSRSDLVLQGPDAVAEWLTGWADALGV